MNNSTNKMKSAINSIANKTTRHMGKFGLVISMLCAFGVFTSPVQAADEAGDPTKGEALHKAKCFGCHDTRMYTRKNRIVHTFEDLQGRVEFCDAASNAGFTLDDIDNVVEYLNVEFYKFKK